MPMVVLWASLAVVVGCDTVYLGIQIQEASGETRTAVLITEVDAGSPADTAGLEPNDVIVSLNLKGVTTVAKLREDIAATALGGAVGLKTFRLNTGTIVESTINLTADSNDVPTSLGMNVQDSNDPSGVAVVSVMSDSAADEAGMLVNDVITKFGTTAIANVEQLRRALATATEDSTVTITFRRDRAEAEETTDVKIGIEVVSQLPILGITVQDLSADLAERLGYPALGGARGDAVLIGGPAFDAGIMPQDVIYQYDGKQISDVSDLVSAVSQRGGSGTVTVGHARGGDLLSTNVTLRGNIGGGGDYTLNVGISLAETLGGLLVVGVVSGGEAERAELQIDDVILAVEGSATLTAQDFYRALDAALDVRPKLTGVSVSTLRSGVAVSRFLRIRTSTSQTDGSGSSTTKTIPYEL
jgi:S1-C subfamily serine protease